MCRWISFKPGVMSDITKLLNLIPVYLTLTFSQGHRYMKEQIRLRSFSSKFLNWFRSNSVCRHTCWPLWAHTILRGVGGAGDRWKGGGGGGVRAWSLFKEGAQFRWFGENMFKIGVRLDALYTDFFQTWFHYRHDWTLPFDFDVNGSVLHSGSQDSEKDRTHAIILLWSGTE